MSERLSAEQLRDVQELPATSAGNVLMRATMRNALLAHISVLEAELQEARKSLAAEHTLGVMRNAMRESAEEECAGKQQVIDELLAATKQHEDANANLQSQLQEAREQNKRVENWRNNLFDYLMSEDAVVKKATNNFRSQLVAAVRNCDWHVDDNVMKLIQSFNPVPDDVVTRLASPVHDEEPNL